MDSAGKKTRGVVFAESRQVAVLKLKKQGLIPTDVKELAETQPEAAPMFGKVSVRNLSMYTRKFAELVRTDIPLTEIFDILAEEEEYRPLKEASEFLSTEVAKGRGLPEAMKERPRCFSPLYIRMIEAGMRSGTLDLIAQNLAKLYETESAFRQKLISRLFYPAGLLAFCFILSIATRALGVLNVGVFGGIMMFWTVVIALILIGITRAGYSLYRRIGFRLPWLGDYMRKINLARFCRIFGLQYASGVPVLEGLDTAKVTLQDPTLSQGVTGLQKRINAGMDLREAMVASGVFPKRMVSMVATGEAAGSVELMLQKLAEYYELDIETGSTIMAWAIWFVVFIAVAVTVGAVVISLWQNYFNMINSLIPF